MKRIAFYCYLLLVTSIKAGGVTIGNGSSYIVGIDLPAFKEKLELLQFSRGLVEETRSGRLLRLQKFKAEGDCDRNQSHLRGLDSFDYYPQATATSNGERYVKGQLIIELFDCKTPEQINHDGFGDVDLSAIDLL